MNLTDIVAYLTTKLSMPVYPIQFPYNNPSENIVVVDIVNGNMAGSKVGGVFEMNIQLMYRSLHPSTAESLASSHITALHQTTKVIQGDWQIVLIESSNTNPYFVGQDEENRFIYTTDFRLLVAKK